MVIIARRPRIDYPGVTFHVIQRGNNKEYIFDNPNYKDYFISLMRNAVEADGAEIFAYVVMSNHFHMALRSYQKPLSKIMHRLNTAYSVFYNLKKERTGHVFQGRYTAIPILNDNYLLAVIRYIHRNPVTARICSQVEDYKWSSDWSYRSLNSGFIECSPFFDLLSGNPKTAREEYRSFVDVDDDINWEDFSYINDESVAEAAEELALANKDARSQVRPLTKNTHRFRATDVPNPFDQSINMPELLDDILLRTGAPGIVLEAIKSGSRQRQLLPYKIAFARSAFRQGYSMKQIGQHINISDSSIYHYLK